MADDTAASNEVVYRWQYFNNSTPTSDSDVLYGDLSFYDFAIM